MSSKKKTCPIAPLIGDEDDYSDPTDHLDENEDNIVKVTNLRTISDYILEDFDADSVYEGKGAMLEKVYFSF